MLAVEINIESKIYRLSAPIRPCDGSPALAGWDGIYLGSVPTLHYQLHVNTSLKYRVSTRFADNLKYVILFLFINNVLNYKYLDGINHPTTC